MLLASIRMRARARLRGQGASAESGKRPVQGRAVGPDPDGGKAEAARLFDEYGTSVYRLAYSYVRNSQDAEDVLQDSLVQFLKTKPVFNDAHHEKAWLLRVAANLAKNRLKSAPPGRVDELSEQLASEDDPDLAFVWDAVAQLPEQQREVIHLFYHEGYTTREIAHILERNESTVRSDLSRGRNALKGVLKEAYDFG